MTNSCIYTWAYIHEVNNGKSARTATANKTRSCHVPVATFSPEQASWENPPLAPPQDPLKYGTPNKSIERDIHGGKLQWASRLITLRRVLYKRLLQPC